MSSSNAERLVELRVVDITCEMRAVMMELAKALDFARRSRRAPWDFAVEMASLVVLGVTSSDLRWLVSEGYVQHARDVSRPGNATRKFRRCENLTFARDTCFVLTEVGRQILQEEAIVRVAAQPSTTGALFAPPPGTMGCRTSRALRWRTGG